MATLQTETQEPVPESRYDARERRKILLWNHAAMWKFYLPFVNDTPSTLSRHAQHSNTKLLRFNSAYISPQCFCPEGKLQLSICGMHDLFAIVSFFFYCN